MCKIELLFFGMAGVVTILTLINLDLGMIIGGILIGVLTFYGWVSQIKWIKNIG